MTVEIAPFCSVIIMVLKQELLFSSKTIETLIVFQLCSQVHFLRSWPCLISEQIRGWFSAAPDLCGATFAHQMTFKPPVLGLPDLSVSVFQIFLSPFISALTQTIFKSGSSTISTMGSLWWLLPSLKAFLILLSSSQFALFSWSLLDSNHLPDMRSYAAYIRSAALSTDFNRCCPWIIHYRSSLSPIHGCPSFLGIIIIFWDLFSILFKRVFVEVCDSAVLQDC